jgi:hypothetical protein
MSGGNVAKFASMFNQPGATPAPAAGEKKAGFNSPKFAVPVTTKIAPADSNSSNTSAVATATSPSAAIKPTVSATATTPSSTTSVKSAAVANATSPSNATTTIKPASTPSTIASNNFTASAAAKPIVQSAFKSPFAPTTQSAAQSSNNSTPSNSTASNAAAKDPLPPPVWPPPPPPSSPPQSPPTVFTPPPPRENPPGADESSSKPKHNFSTPNKFAPPTFGSLKHSLPEPLKAAVGSALQSTVESPPVSFSDDSSADLPSSSPGKSFKKRNRPTKPKFSNLQAEAVETAQITLQDKSRKTEKIVPGVATAEDRKAREKAEKEEKAKLEKERAEKEKNDKEAKEAAKKAAEMKEKQDKLAQKAAGPIASAQLSSPANKSYQSPAFILPAAGKPSALSPAAKAPSALCVIAPGSNARRATRSNSLGNDLAAANLIAKLAAEQAERQQEKVSTAFTNSQTIISNIQSKNHAGAETLTISAHHLDQLKTELYNLRIATETLLNSASASAKNKKMGAKSSHNTLQSAHSQQNNLQEVVFFCGYLEKEDSSGKKWNSRWFVLTKNSLLYYNKQSDTSPKENISLESSTLNVVAGRPSQAKDKQQPTLELTALKRRYYLSCSSAEELAAWNSALTTRLLAFNYERRCAMIKQKPDARILNFLEERSLQRNNATDCSKIIEAVPLTLSGEQLSLDSVSVIARVLESPLLPPISVLTIENSNLGAIEVEVLIEALIKNNNSKLHTVNFSENLLALGSNSADGWKAIGRLIAKSKEIQLKHLILQHCGLDEQAAKAIKQGFSAVNNGNSSAFLQRLVADNNEINAAALQSLVDILAPKNNDYQLQHLELQNNYLDSKSGPMLAELLKQQKHLLFLNLRDNKLNCEAIEPFAAALRNHQNLLSIDLSSNLIGDKGNLAISHAVQVNTSLEQIRFNQFLLDRQGLAMMRLVAKYGVAQ